MRPFKQSAAQAVNAKFKGKQYGPRIRKFLDNHPADVILSCSIPSAKYVIEDAGCTLPVVEMIHSHPKVQFPDLSEAEKRATEKCKVMQILLPSGLELARQYFPHLPIVVIGNAVAPAKKLAHPLKTLMIHADLRQLMGEKGRIAMRQYEPDLYLESVGKFTARICSKIK